MRIEWLTLIVFLYTTLSFAQNSPLVADSLAKRIETAMINDVRTSNEQSRDENRKPIETLKFMRLKDDMRVVELVPQKGWYTKILGQVLAEHGELYIALDGDNWVDALAGGHESLSKVKILPFKGELVPVTDTGIPVGLFDLREFSIPIDDVDLVLTFRNYHNFSETGRAAINDAVFESLKPGGLYGIIDHTRRHNEPTTVENWRRMDPVLVIREVQAAGFMLLDFSGLHYRPDDELRYEVGRHSVTGNTDRFALPFEKPN